MRTDIRLFRLEKFGFPTELATGTKPPPPLLTAGVELAGQTATVNSQPFATTLKERWAKRGVVFGSLDSLVHEHSDLIRRNLYPRLIRRPISSPPCTRPAGAAARFYMSRVASSSTSRCT